MFIRIILFLIGFFIASPIHAHELGVARVNVEKINSDTYIYDAFLPKLEQLSDPILPENCEILDSYQKQPTRSNFKYYWKVKCVDNVFSYPALKVDWPVEGIFLSKKHDDTLTDGIFIDSVDSEINLHFSDASKNIDSIFVVMADYVVLGIKHILIGLDHLAFVLLLCLLAERRNLIKLITLFTVGHSITLILASLDMVSVSIPAVEVCIALSIAWMAREKILLSGASLRNGSGIILLFGLLHGLGFASALSEAGINGEHMIASLLSFNLGVELGQLFAIGVFLLLIKILNEQLPKLQTLNAIPLFLGAIAFYWAIERTAGIVAS